MRVREMLGLSERPLIKASYAAMLFAWMQERGETAFENRLLTHLIDARYGAMRPTIIIANLTAKELGETLGPSIVDRVFEDGKRIDFTWDSYRRAGR